MDTRKVLLWALLLSLLFPLTGCTPLPQGAKDAVLASFPPEEEPRLLSTHKARLLPEDAAAGVEEVWCVEVAYRCWSCPHGEWRTCVSGYLVRRIEKQWESAEMRTEEEWAEWEARGCPVVPEAP
ncbi:MAG TPA: hypothetical protein G4O00_12830 [Thermoflexia bacterium]|jgi:hypothetical protein|nr:hypothetical protein [Thermoflexia bacterium]